MNTIEPVVRANVLSEMSTFVASANGNIDQLLASVGLTADAISDPERYISLNTVAELFELAARHTRDPSFGLHYAEIYPEGGSGLLGHLMLTAPTVGAVLEIIVEYIEVHMMMMRVKLERNDDTYSLFVSYPAHFSAPQIQYTGFILAALVLRLRRGAGSSWRPQAVQFAHRRPERLRDYQHLFGANLTFDAPRNRLDVETDDYNKPMPKLLDRLSETVLRTGKQALAEARIQGIVERTFAVVSERLETERPVDMDSVAEQLEISIRALQWRLEQSGTSFERVLTRTRKQLALHLLRDTDLPISEIAGRLGYSEASPFARAARKWFKGTPTAYRRRLREADPGIATDSVAGHSFPDESDT